MSHDFRMVAEAAAELQKRRLDALELYRLTPKQVEVLQDCHDVRSFLLKGGNRCLGGEQEIYDPMREAYRRVDQIDGAFHVEAREPHTGNPTVATADRPFIKSRERFYRFHLSNGSHVTAARRHTVLCATTNTWASIGDWKQGLKIVCAGPGDSVAPFPWEIDHPAPGPALDDADVVEVVREEFVRYGDIWDFTVPETGNYVLDGVLHHNSAKSHTASVRFASIVRNKPLIAMDGTQVECIAEHQRSRKLLTWLVGLQLDHIGQTMHRLLFRAGLFDIVRDKKTNMWRAWHPPMYPEDFDIPRSERKPSPPLIPASEIAEWSWEKKSEHQFSMCRLKNGNEIYAFASSAPVKAGDPVDEIWIDEEIKFPKHFAEWQARLVDRDGRLFWSSWPAHANPALLNLNKQCEREAREVAIGEREYVTAKKATLRMSENPFFTKKQVADTLSGWDEAERRARDLGEFTTDLIRLYGEFDEDIHRCDYDNPEMDDEVAKALRANGWVPPRDWTRDLILDPGTAHPAILLCAIPPPHLWQENEPYYVPYREIYKARLTAGQLAKEVCKTERGFMFERFYIDGHAARQTPMGFSGTIGSNYSMAFARENLSSLQMPGSGFIPGDPDPAARGLVLRSLMRIRPCGYPQLRIVKERCPNLVEQLRDTTRHIVSDETKEVPAPGQQIDVMVCLEYYASRYPTFVWPREAPRPKSPAQLALEEERALEEMRSGSSHQPTYFGAKT